MRLGDLVDEVLTADRGAGTVEPQRERLDLAALLHQAVEDERSTGVIRNVKIALAVEAPFEVDGASPFHGLGTRL